MDDNSHDPGKSKIPTIFLHEANFKGMGKNEQQPPFLSTQGPGAPGIRTTLCEGEWRPSLEYTNEWPTRNLPDSFSYGVRRDKDNPGGPKIKQQRNVKHFGNSQGPKNSSSHLGHNIHPHVREPNKQNASDPHSSRSSQNRPRNLNSRSEHLLYYQNITPLK